MKQSVVMAWLVCVVAMCGSMAVMAARDSAGVRLGGIQQSIADATNNLEMEVLARFAINEYNNKKNSLLEFVRVVKVAQQIVSGIMYHLTIEAKDGTSVNLYEARIWVKPWSNFQKLQDFKLADRN
ncbi:Chain A, Adhiron: A Stable And Versatile Peptide Display Scaffold - Full Length Adhiron [Carex littledalei]|uniref:Cysteine proteinase inhibitor n=1 Tax=Carex littledalei TaxID=544730 RepID=A0A833QZH4_9POAL|nr:Chain A, Adhiron: A Stable And Versatile Peptide Display Scaffold - Full Length Adhiron [Carex littledalei]